MNEATTTNETATADDEAPAPAPAPAPVTVTVGGREFTPAPLGLTELGQLCAWAKGRQPNPIAAVKPHLEGLDERTQRYMIDRAMDEVRQPVVFGTPEFVGAVMQTGEGFREVLWLSLRRAGAGVTRPDSDAAADALDVERAGDVMVAALRQS